MNISLILLKNGLTLVSETDQLDYEPAVHLTDPMTISGSTKLTLKQWPEHSGDNHVLLRSEDLLTVCEPSENLLAVYLKKTGKTLTETKAEVTIDEGERPAEEIPYGDPLGDQDDYEPHYVEELI